MSKLKYFAVWSRTSGYAHDVYPEEIQRDAASLRKQGRNVRGPFDTQEKALAVVDEALRQEARRAPMSTGETGQTEKPPRSMTDLERLLINTLTRLACHDVAADQREQQTYHCLELQHAMQLLNDITGEEMFQFARDGRVTD
jgi:hypothetical protein